MLRWELTEWSVDDAKLSRPIELDPWGDYALRCERDGELAGRQGIGCVLRGELLVDGERVQPFGAFPQPAELYGKGSACPRRAGAGRRTDRATHWRRARSTSDSRGAMRIALALLLAVALAGCGSDNDEAGSTAPVTVTETVTTTETTTAPVEPEVECSTAGLRLTLPEQELPAAVADVRKRIFDAAVACDYETLEQIALEKGEGFTFSYGADASAAEYWRQREEPGDAEPGPSRCGRSRPS